MPRRRTRLSGGAIDDRAGAGAVLGSGRASRPLSRRPAPNPELGVGIFIGQVLQGLIASLVVQGALQKRVKSEKDFNVYQNQLTVMMNITMRAAVWTPSTPSRRNILNVIYISLANIPTFFAEKVSDLA